MKDLKNITMIKKIKNIGVEIYYAIRYDFPHNAWIFEFEKDIKKWEFYCGREFYDWWHYALIIGPISIYSFPGKGEK